MSEIDTNLKDFENTIHEKLEKMNEIMNRRSGRDLDLDILFPFHNESFSRGRIFGVFSVDSTRKVKMFIFCITNIIKKGDNEMIIEAINTMPNYQIEKFKMNHQYRYWFIDGKASNGDALRAFVFPNLIIDTNSIYNPMQFDSIPRWEKHILTLLEFCDRQNSLGGSKKKKQKPIKNVHLVYSTMPSKSAKSKSVRKSAKSARKTAKNTGASCGNAYCMTCRKKGQPMVSCQQKNKNGRSMMTGHCGVCKGKMVKFIASQK